MTESDPQQFATAGPFEATWRATPGRFPPIQAFEQVASANDLEAVMALEGWTDDRLVRHRLYRLPRDQWVFGRPNASVIMAAFLHASPEGSRFADAALGAWYASLAETTAIKEVAHHLRREVIRSGRPDIVSQYLSYQARLAGTYVDIRGLKMQAAMLYRPDDYAAGQAFGARVRASDRAGIVYDSVRDLTGINVVAFRPPAVLDVVQGRQLELTVRPAGKIVVRLL